MVQIQIQNTIPLEKILVENSNYNRCKLKERLYIAGLKKRECELCGQNEEWQGKHMSLILDHINGIHDDNRIKNLRIVCPNCNGTLETHCRGNKWLVNIERKKKIKEENIRLANFNKRKVKNRPDIETLKNEIEILGLEGTGRKYGVSGNAVKKWIKN
jgi:hypothetical protein